MIVFKFFYIVIIIMLNTAEFYHTDITHSSEYKARIEDIEADVYYDIRSLINNNSGGLYKTDKFKCAGHNIDIMYPGHSNPDLKVIFRGPDHTRFLLSLYPCKHDLTKVDYIVLRPRYFEIDGTELMSLYLRKEKILVLYLFHPHLYCTNNMDFHEFSGAFNSGIANLCERKKYSDDGSVPSIMVPPLWHILSTISYSPDDRIEKFFVRAGSGSASVAPAKIYDISFHYSRLGY